jgi:hypothetical protein
MNYMMNFCSNDDIQAIQALYGKKEVSKSE